jgi:hypothetical protein
VGGERLRLGWAESGWGCGEDGGFDPAGAGEAEGGGGAGEGAAGGGQVVDQQEAATGVAVAGLRRWAWWGRSVGAAHPPGATQVAAARRGEQADQREVEGGGDAGGDPLGMVPGRSGDPTGGDEGDQVGPDAGGSQGRPQPAAELGQGGWLAVELTGQDRGSQSIAIGPEGPHHHLRVGGQHPRTDGSRNRREAASAAGPGGRGATGQAGGRAEEAT